MNNLIIAGGDIETTGLLTPDHRLIETYTGLYRGGSRIFAYEQRIDPGRSIAADAQRVHGISSADLFGKPSWEDVANDHLKVFSKAHMIIFHNAEFDWNFYKQEFQRIGKKLPDIPVFDTMTEGVWATSDGKQPRLEELAFACEVEYDPAAAHAAHYDVGVMMECFFKGLEWGFFELPEALRESQALAA
jgi:DNA polymerase-3 subunit epsilon